MLLLGNVNVKHGILLGMELNLEFIKVLMQEKHGLKLIQVRDFLQEMESVELD